MKIYILPTSSIVKPPTGPRAPAFNQDYGVEQNFLDWLQEQPDIVTGNPKEADWDYLPVWYNRIYCNAWGGDNDIVASEILRCVSRNRPTFTISEYDLMSYHRDFDFCNMVIFTASRREDNGSIDIPLLCSLHQPVSEPAIRQWRASFMGKFETDGSREMMRQALEGRPDVYLSESQDERTYTELLANSEITLAPRGYGGQTFRFYEALQFASVPFLIGDLDTRPFKQWIDWEQYSFYAQTGQQIIDVLDSVELTRLWEMGEDGRKMFFNELYYNKWGKYVLMQLSQIS